MSSPDFIGIDTEPYEVPFVRTVVRIILKILYNAGRVYKKNGEVRFPFLFFLLIKLFEVES